MPARVSECKHSEEEVSKKQVKVGEVDMDVKGSDKEKSWPVSYRLTWNVLIVMLLGRGGDRGKGVLSLGVEGVPMMGQNSSSETHSEGGALNHIASRLYIDGKEIVKANGFPSYGKKTRVVLWHARSEFCVGLDLPWLLLIWGLQWNLSFGDRVTFLRGWIYSGLANMDWRRRPFRFQANWITHPTFNELI
ncbi:hypothetical protein RJT34_22116 [Clitoria ternatea]|uniref:Uncharacterized protein n=1 Tax=Clitoria ternatea TaxID=43366 RepID=A0AAN9P649_CLITE